MFRTFLMATAAAVVASSVSAATVVNGDFETSFSGAGNFGDEFGDLAGGTRGGSWDVFDNIPGWATTDGYGIEIQSNNTLNSIDAHSGEHYVELNSHGGRGNSNSTMAQQIMLDIGTYVLSFWYSPRNNVAGGNTIDYGIAGIDSGSISGPDAETSVGSWTEVTMEFDVATAGDYSLFFAANGSGNKHRGGLIDTVSVSQVPLPASAVLLLAGLGGLGAMRRRQKA